jgi:GNAT superfamily N-acetyltransferase
MRRAEGRALVMEASSHISFVIPALRRWSGLFCDVLLARHFPSRNLIMPNLVIRAIEPHDLAAWMPLWDGYNAFYGREGDSALPSGITETTWHRFFDPHEPVFAIVAEYETRLIGLAHYLYHRSTVSVEPVCYLQDLYTEFSERGRGIGRALIQAVYERAAGSGCREVYWQTHESNIQGRLLYDQLAQHQGFIVYDHDL